MEDVIEILKEANKVFADMFGIEEDNDE